MKKAYIYNYFSTSYGLRSNGHLLMILVDQNFTIFDSKIIDFNLRDSKLIDIEEDFKTCITPRHLCTVVFHFL